MALNIEQLSRYENSVRMEQIQLVIQKGQISYLQHYVPKLSSSRGGVQHSDKKLERKVYKGHMAHLSVVEPRHCIHINTTLHLTKF